MPDIVKLCNHVVQSTHLDKVCQVSLSIYLQVVLCFK